MKSYSDSYKAAGVDVTAGYESVELMKEHVKRTVIPGVVSGIGGFGGLFAPDLSGMEDMTAGDLCAVAKLANRELGVTPIPEMTLPYAMYMAARASHKPVEFFKGLPPVEAMKLKNLVTGFLYGGDGEE